MVEPLALKPKPGRNNLTVTYITEYEDECNNGTKLVSRPLQVVISKGETALHVLENAMLSVNDSQYQFTSTYFKQLGYHVHTINGTSDTFGIEDVPCYWSFLIKQPTSSERVAPEVGVAHYFIPGDNYTVIMWYNNNPYVDANINVGVQNMPLVSVFLLSVICSVCTSVYTFSSH